jgi:hypothetical protein
METQPCFVPVAEQQLSFRIARHTPMHRVFADFLIGNVVELGGAIFVLYDHVNIDLLSHIVPIESVDLNPIHGLFLQIDREFTVIILGDFFLRLCLLSGVNWSHEIVLCGILPLSHLTELKGVLALAIVLVPLLRLDLELSPLPIIDTLACL